MRHVPVTRIVSEYSIDRSTFWRWVKRGWMPKPVYLGGRAYIRREDYDAFCARADAGGFVMLRKPPVLSGNTVASLN